MLLVDRPSAHSSTSRWISLKAKSLHSLAIMFASTLSKCHTVVIYVSGGG